MLALAARSADAPDSSATRLQTGRAARSLAIEANWSAVTAKRNSTASSAASTDSPASVSARR